MPEVTSEFPVYEEWKAELVAVIDRIVPALASSQEPTKQLLSDLMFLKAARNALIRIDQDNDKDDDDEPDMEAMSEFMSNALNPEDRASLERGVELAKQIACKTGVPLGGVLITVASDFEKRLVAAGIDPRATRREFVKAVASGDHEKAKRLREETSRRLVEFEAGLKK